MTTHSLADASFDCCSVPSAISRHIFAKCRNLRRVAGLAAVKAVRRQSLAFFGTGGWHRSRRPIRGGN
jgi:hypothetical protein